MQQQVADKAADTAAAGSAFLAGAAWVAEVEPIITAVAGLVAIVAGGMAAWYHYERAKATHSKRIADRVAEEAAKEAAHKAAEAAAERVFNILEEERNK